MRTGKHLIVDVLNIVNYELLNTIGGVKPLMKKIIRDMKLCVVGGVQKQFEPVGATCSYLLSESHLSIHTYPELRLCAIDLYCCNESIDMDEVLDIIYNYFDGDCIMNKNIINR